MVLVVIMLRRRARGRRHFGVVAVHVGAERMRHDAGGERVARDAIREMTAVADIDLQPGIDRGADDAVNLALTIDEAAGMARERMRQNIAGPQLRDHAFQDRVGIFAVGTALGQAPQRAEMDVKRQVGAAADLGRHFQNLDAPAREAADLGVALDAAHDVLVGVGRRHGGVDIDAGRAVEIGVVVAFKAADQIGRQEGKDLRLRLLDDEAAEAGQGHARRAALIDHGGDAGSHADHIRVQAEAAGDVLIDVGVGVDQARQHQLARNVDHLAGA